MFCSEAELQQHWTNETPPCGLESGASGDAKVMQNKIQKLQTVNAELKTRLRMYETKSTSSKFQERNEIKMLQAKVEKLNTHNMELKMHGTNAGF